MKDWSHLRASFHNISFVDRHVPFGARVVKAQTWLHKYGMGELYHYWYSVKEYILWELHSALCTKGDITGYIVQKDRIPIYLGEKGSILMV